MFAERIKILRQQKDLSQQELAKIVGKTQQAVGLWEKEGGNEPDHETLNKLADIHVVGNFVGNFLTAGQAPGAVRLFFCQFTFSC